MTSYVFNTSFCLTLGNNTAVQGLVPSIKLHETLLLVTGFGLFTTLVALLFVCIRRRVYKDRNTLDTAFDAGGKVSVGLTATTIVSQWTWAATLLYSCTVASKYGVSGPFWYAAGATIQILMFAMVSVQLKVRAPGAKTFLQVIRARFGSSTHKVFVVYALLTNIIVTANSMLGGSAVLSGLTKDMGVEYAAVLMAAVIGTYTMIGGLGATFYVSFFNTAMICIMMLVFVVRVFDDGDNQENPLGSETKVYDYLTCSQGPEGNKDRSFLTLISNSGFMFGMITVAGGFGTSFVDQSYWQSSVAAKPKQGVLGFLAGGLVWFSIPFALATTMGLAYIALSAQQNKPLLSNEEVELGLVLPVVAQRMFGRAGEMMIIVMILMAVVSTGSAEVVAVTSILVYDIYQLYLKPFRLVHDANSCILCGKGRGRKASVRDKCTCESMTVCQDCARDNRQRSQCSNRALKPSYQCRTHGTFREYTDYLLHMKNWCLLWTTLGTLPLTILLYTFDINLTVVHLFMGVIVNSAVIPITLSMFWERLTGLGMITGSIGGTSLAFIAWLSVSASYPGGLAQFKDNAVREASSLTGNLVSLLSGGIISVLVSLLLGQNKEGPEVWEKTRDIDNPLSPWTELYEKDLNLTGAYRLDNRPSLRDVSRAFRSAKFVAVVGSLALSVLLIVIWPCIMIGISVMSFNSFYQWVTVSKVWAFLATIFIVVTPFATEIWDIYRAFVRNVRNVITKTYPEPLHIKPVSHPSNENGGPVSMGQNLSDSEKTPKDSESNVKLTDVDNVLLSSVFEFRTVGNGTQPSNSQS